MKKTKLSKKISILLIAILFFVILLMSVLTYTLSKNFYKDHLSYEVQHRVTSHVAAMEAKFDLDTIHHVLKMEQHGDVQLILYDVSFQPLVKSEGISSAIVEEYSLWIQHKLQSDHLSFPIIEEVPAAPHYHIPHIWAVQPISINEVIVGYLFIDQDTAEFESQKLSLIKLIIFMALLTFFIGFLLLVYLINKISKPLQNMGRATNKIAKGEFDTELIIQSDDEMGQLGRDIQQMANHLKKYRDSRQQFLSHISHDLRTPLTYIKGYSAIMKDSDSVNEEEWRKHSEIIYREATRMEHLVRDLFQLTKLDEGKLELDLQDTEVNSWINGIVESKHYILQQKDIILEFNSNKQNINVSMDQAKMTQVLSNLLENSIRYTDRQGSIKITTVDIEGEVIIEVSDTGIGIPESELPYVWGRFYRVDKSRTSESGGSGLGLAIVKQLIELHGGRIEVKSYYGKGTTFTIYLLKDRSNKKN